MTSFPFVEFSEEVSDARNDNAPIVCLESTVFSRLGLPSPENSEALRRCLNLIRDNNVTPAVTGVVDGKVCLGLNDIELERVLEAEVKIAVQDLGSAVAKKCPVGVTTVSASLAIASAAGERVFCTGGIGGVHRGAEKTGDVSADLFALSRFNVVCVSAGAKVFLDIPRTLEFLESLGVPVLGWRTNQFPAFYLRDSGLKINQIQSGEEVTEILNTHTSLGLPNGVLVTVPIPEEEELDPIKINELIASSILEVERLGVSGRDVTPFILERLAENTQGESVPANIALLENNAQVACEIAKLF